MVRELSSRPDPLETRMSTRTRPPFRADHVGSFLRPKYLLDAREQRAKGEITAEQLRAVEDKAITEIVKFQQDVGLQSITDGEFRRTYFHIDFLEQLGGVKTDIPVTIKKPDGTEELAPPVMRVIDKVTHAKNIQRADFEYLKSQVAAGNTPKVTIPSPTMLHFRGGRAGISKQAYPELDPVFYDDVAKAYGDELLEEVDVEVGAAELAVGDALQADVLLELHDLGDGLVFDGAKLLGRDLAPGFLLARFEQVFGAQETADVVETGGQGGVLGHRELRQCWDGIEHRSGLSAANAGYREVGIYPRNGLDCWIFGGLCIHSGSMNTSPSFPLNAWYAAAYDVEVKHALLSRTVCNQKLVLYRQTDGQVAVLEDACWHRLLPLSMGRLEGDEVVCGYHGLVYNAQGRCTFMPSQETLNPSACALYTRPW